MFRIQEKCGIPGYFTFHWLWEENHTLQCRQCSICIHSASRHYGENLGANTPSLEQKHQDLDHLHQNWGFEGALDFFFNKELSVVSQKMEVHQMLNHLRK